VAAKPSRDVRRWQIARLHLAQRLEAAREGRVFGGCRCGAPELGADDAGEVGVGGLPGSCRRIAEHGGAQAGERLGLVAFQQVADAVEIDPAALGQGDRESEAGWPVTPRSASSRAANSGIVMSGAASTAAIREGNCSESLPLPQADPACAASSLPRLTRAPPSGSPNWR